MQNNLKTKYLLVASSILLISSCGSGSSSEDETVIAQVPSELLVVTLPPVNLTTLVDGTEVSTDELVALGEIIFNDTNLSSPIGQSCATCHNATVGFDDPNNQMPTSLGADDISIGTRNSPTASYAAHIPEPQTVQRTPPGGGQQLDVLIGGLFLDGRAATLEDQVKGPFLNPVEMGNSTKADLIDRIIQANYATDFEQLFGDNVLLDVDKSYDYVADAIAAFERTDIFSPFNSTFDLVRAGTASFTASESRGMQLYRGKAQCETCHLLGVGGGNPNQQIHFTDFAYHNIGTPRNTILTDMLSDPQFVDIGLGAVTADPRDDGKFRTPTLRNIAITAPYMHNGVFNSLTEVVEFYNTRDTTFNVDAEVNRNVNQGGNIGELGLTSNEVVDLVAFLETLTDQ